MSLVRIDRNPSDRTLRQFAVSWLVLMIIVALILKLKLGLIAVGLALLAFGFVVATIGWLRPQAIRWFFVGWMIGLFPVNFVISHVILFSLYYFLFTPIGLLLRLMGKDPLERNWDPDAETYWQRHTPPDKLSRYFRQF